MLFLRSGGGAAAAFGGALVRCFSRERAVDVRRIKPKVPRVEAIAISKRLYQILKDHGPLSVGDTWNQAKDANIDGLNSKTNMKIMLKWMTGRKMVKLSCTLVESAKKAKNPKNAKNLVKMFHYSILPEDPKATTASLPSPTPETSNSPSEE